ncbi:MAG TPA: L,D-transpeptidase family protein [Allosphingosinicella sp.]|uniref:L,D-transpeptidase family protein n=1 Tax=Allosphingosinicella sp. TaxID=2823234 RepID=UPI002EDA5715
MSRIVKLAISAAVVPLLGMAAVPAAASTPLASPMEAMLQSSDSGVRAFYSSRDNRPIWIRSGLVLADAHRLVDILRRADLDGMRNGPELAERLEETIARAESGEPQDLARAELMLSSAWVDYVQTLRRPVDVGMTYIDASLKPRQLSEESILRAAAEAPSLGRHIDIVSNHNAQYAQLRQGLADLLDRTGGSPRGADARLEQRLRLNMDRARVLPAADYQGKYVLVDAATQTLWMYENGEARDSMRVVVGKPERQTQTPMLAGLIRFSVLNPYWNVPPDLVRKNIAPNVLDQGASYLRSKGYEVLSGWTDDARTLDPESVDWQAVASGSKELRVRQLPGGDNFMGDVKFMFPNEFGVYLHDTPDKSLFSEAQRTLSSGCVRLEDAPRLARWLYGQTPRAASDAPEQAVALKDPVPVYITYLTAEWDGGRLALRDDFYGRDSLASYRMASAGSGALD